MDELKDPVINIAVAAQIMAEKRAHFGKAWLWKYNGATRENGYTHKVLVIEAALGGVRLVLMCKPKKKCSRVRRLVDLILAVTAPRIATEN